MAVLEGVAGPAQGAVFPLDATQTTIGKRHGNDIALDDPTLSRAHARIERRGDRYYLIDLQSTNGTRLNGLLVREAPLRPGDEIAVGASVLRVRDQARVALVKEGNAPAVAATVVVGPQLAGLRPPPDTSLDVRHGVDALAKLAREGLMRSDLKTALGRVLDVVFDVLPAERGALILLAPDERTPREYALRTREGGKSPPGDMPVSWGLAQRVMAQREAVLVPDARVDPALAERSSIIQHGVRCAAYAPLLREDRVLGLLCVDTSVPGGLTQQHVELLVAFANQAAVNVESVELQDRVLRERKRWETLQRYVSPHVADRIIATEGGLPQSGEAELTVLFADLDGFTGLAQKLAPAEVQALLNAVFSRMTAVAFRFGGAVDKYIGDCIMVLWGTPGEDDYHALRAVVAAEAMVRELQQFRQSIADRYGSLGLALGLNSGRAFVGDMGSESVVQYTAIGHVVNVASRIQGLAERDQIFASARTVELCGDAVVARSRGRHVLRGTEGDTEVYEIVGLADDGLRTQMAEPAEAVGG